MKDDEATYLLKELDLIDNTISRLDQQIQTSKTVCITLWTAWNGWFLTKGLEYFPINEIAIVVLFSVIFPIIFWKVDSYYRKALLSTSKRQNLISLYLNKGDGEFEIPVLDPVGWLYDMKNYLHMINTIRFDLTKEKLVELESVNIKRPYFYKEVIWFYLPLILMPVLLGIYFLLKQDGF